MLAIVGIIISGAVMVGAGFDFSKLVTHEYVTNTYTVSEEFDSISISVKTEDIEILPSEDGECKLVCRENVKITHTVAVVDRVLTIGIEDNRSSLIDYIGIGGAFTKSTLYLPTASYDELSVSLSTGDVKVCAGVDYKNISVKTTTGDVECLASSEDAIFIFTRTGDITVRDISAGVMKLVVDTGDISAHGVRCDGDISITADTGDTTLNDVRCGNLIAETDTGDLMLKDTVADGRFDIETDTGDVTFDGADAAEIYIETDTGDVIGSLLSDKVFIVETNTGRKDVPHTVVGGRCEISTDTGDVIISIK